MLKQVNKEGQKETIKTKTNKTNKNNKIKE